MELDKLKESWQSLDEHLQRHSMTDERNIAELITAHKNSIKHGVGRLAYTQRWGMIIGALFFIAIIVVSLFSLTRIEDAILRQRLYTLVIFCLVLLALGGVWDWYTYKKIKEIHIDRMSILEVSKRMITIHKLACYEVIAICVLIPISTAILYFILGYQHYPANTQILIITITLIADILILYYIYKKLLFRHLNNIRTNINELKDLCTE